MEAASGCTWTKVASVSVLVYVGVEGKQTGLVRLDDLEELSEELLKDFELPCLYRERSDYDEWCDHDGALREDFGLTGPKVSHRDSPIDSHFMGAIQKATRLRPVLVECIRLIEIKACVRNAVLWLAPSPDSG